MMKSNVPNKTNLIEIHLYDRYVHFTYYTIKKIAYVMQSLF